MALCAICERLGQELAASYPPDNLKFQSARPLRQHARVLGARETYACQACGARWIRDLGPTAKNSVWTQCVVRQGNVAPESRLLRPASNRRRDAA